MWMRTVKRCWLSRVVTANAIAGDDVLQFTHGSGMLCCVNEAGDKNQNVETLYMQEISIRNAIM